MRYLLSILLTVVLGPVAALAQSLPHNIPDFGKRLPGCTIVEARQTLELSTERLECLAVRGTVVIKDGADLRLGTVLGYPGSVIRGERDGMSARITILDRPIDARLDPEQYGTGIITLGAFHLTGATRTGHVRLTAEPKAGTSRLELAVPDDWAVGDVVFVPDTRQVPSHDRFNRDWPLRHERRAIAARTATSVTLDAPLRFDHPGARNFDGSLHSLPHVANLTRSILIQSENPAGTRGHLLFTERADVRLHGVAVVHMGRTTADPVHSWDGSTAGRNQIGRYPVHFHHLFGPVNRANTGFQYSITGSVVMDSRKWPVAIHASSFGLVQDNVVIGGEAMAGSGISLEAGNEYENLIARNFVGDIRGHMQPRNSGPQTPSTPPANGEQPGSAGECIWGAGFANRFVGNVVTGCRNAFQEVASGVGFKFAVIPQPYTTAYPRFRGADLHNASQTRPLVPQQLPILEFRDNEAYGLMADGITIWNLGTNGYQRPETTQPETVLENFKVWHAYEGAVWLYPTNRVTIRNLTYRVDESDPPHFQGAVTSGDYRTFDLRLIGADIQAQRAVLGILDPVGTIRIENVVAETRQTAFEFMTPATPGTGAIGAFGRSEGARIQLINNRVTSSRPVLTLEHRLAHPGQQDASSPYTVEISQHQGVSGQDFRVYFLEQGAADLYGGKAPCQGRRPDIVGLVCPISKLP